MKTPELLSPAGSATAMVAAVQCGADAIYLGAGDFNARRGAENFGGELRAAVGYCHARGAKAYVALNTMVRQDELPRLEATAEEICASGADGAIVQDFGVARFLRRCAPDLRLHASTQMAVHNPQGVKFLAENGFSRVVLAREMRFDEIARCAGLGAELEVFVHGALCVACSGQCLLSSMIGGRSGNRGLCAQPCRMRYRMDGREGYLLSTRDLCALDDLDALARAGVDSFKIEGRLKRPEYVAQTTAVYRAALDALADGHAFDASAARAELAQMFNRGGFTRGYGPGVDDCALMYAGRPNHLGVEIGVCQKSGEVGLRADIDGRDALVLRRAGADDRPVHPGALRAGHVQLREAQSGDRLIRLVSEAQMRDARARFAGEHRRFPVDVRLKLRVGEAAELELSDGVRRISVAGEKIEAAQARPADPVRIRAQIEKLGDTPFMPRGYAAEIDEDVFISLSALNALRRRAAEALIEARSGAPHAFHPKDLAEPNVQNVRCALPEICAQSGDADVLVRALAAGADALAYAPEDLRPEALDAVLNALPPRFDLVLPPVTGEETLRGLNAWAMKSAGRIRRVYISNIGQLGLAWPGEPAGDMHLNIANEWSVRQLSDWGVKLYTPSVELNRAQIAALGGARSLIVYGALPLMLLRHCPLRAVHGLHGAHAACRRCDSCAPDERASAKFLTDRTGAAFPLRRIATPEGCVIELLNVAKLMLLRRAASLPESVCWRLMLDKTDPVEAIVRLHRIARAGGDVRSDPEWTRVAAANTTTGHYFRGAE